MVYDSAHVFHVAKTGDDANGGLAQQYPIDLAADAKLTIAGALAVAADGDMIVLWPGSYDEAVDFDTANKSIHLKGMGNQNECIIALSAGTSCITLEDNCTLENISVVCNTSPVGYGVILGAKTNIRILGCHIEGTNDGLFLSGANRRLICRESTFKSGYDSVALGTVKGAVFDNCLFQTDGSYGATTSTKALYGGGSRATFNNCVFESTKSSASTGKSIAVQSTNDVWVLNSCVIFADTDASGAAGNVVALYNNGGCLTLNGCSLKTTNSGVSSSYDIQVVAGSVVVNGCNYDISRTTGEIVASSWHLDKRTRAILGKR